MNFVDFGRIGDAFANYWNYEYSGRCLIYLTSPKKALKSRQFSDYNDLTKYWSDGEEILKRYREEFENTYFLAESFPLINLNLGAAGHAGYFNNVKYKFADNTVWFFPLGENEQIFFSKDAYLYKKTIELAKYFSNENKGEFIVSMPDIAGNLDALVHLRGSENVMISMVDEPNIVKKDLKIIQEAWENMTSEVFNVLKENNYGGSSIGWMGTYAKGLHSQLQSDISVMLSSDFFDEFVYEELEKQADFLDYPTYHLDGVEQIRHLDKLLSIEKIKMIQYTCVVGQPSPVDKIDVLRKIQKSGKLLMIIVKPEWVKPLLENLSARGLFLKITADNPEQADDLFNVVCKYSKIW